MSRKKTTAIVAITTPALIKGQCHEICEAMKAEIRLKKV
jgi:hypothetical protein